jgi:hypothetical protein
MQETEVLAHFDRVWNRLAEVNAACSDDEIAADIQAARSVQETARDKPMPL